MSWDFFFPSSHGATPRNVFHLFLQFQASFLRLRDNDHCVSDEKPSADCSTAALKQELALDSGATVLNHSMSLVQRMESLLALGNGSDVALRVQTVGTDEVKVIQAHSLVLTMQSDVFEELLLTRNNSAVVLSETADCAAVFDKFVR